MTTPACLVLPASTLAGPATAPRHRWKVLAAGVLANAAFSVAFSGIPMTAVLIRSGYRLDAAGLGLVLGLMGLGIALSELPWGLLTDRWGDRPVLLTGLLGTALALAAMALWAAPSGGHIPSRSLLAGGLVLVGLLGGSVNGASGRAVMTWFADGERGLAMSIRQTAVPMGGALGAVLLPALAQHGGFAAVYGLLALLCAGAAALAWAWVHEPPPVAGRGRSAKPDAEGPSPLRELQAWRIVAGIGILCGPQFAVLSFGTVFLHDVAHVRLGVITAAMAVMQVGAMALRVWSGHWTDRRRNRPAYLRACSMLSAALFAALAVATLLNGHAGDTAGKSQWMLLGILVAAGMAVSAWHGVAYTELAVMVGAGRAGTALGMANTSVFGVCFLVPFSIPYLLSGQGWWMVWGLAAACAIVAVWLLAPRLVTTSRGVPKTSSEHSNLTRP